MAKSNQISEREAIRRRDETLRVMLRTAPKPQSEMKLGYKKTSRLPNPPKNKA
jgi:hypothetical protein